MTNKYADKDIEPSNPFIYKKILLNVLIEKGFLDLERKHYDPRFRQASYYMKLNQRFLKPLAKELKYIRISKDKRNKKFFITEKGQLVLQIFKYLI